jgi:hypothetical protein
MVIETCTIAILACGSVGARRRFRRAGAADRQRRRALVCDLLRSRGIGAVQARRFPAQRSSSLTALNRIATQLA